MERDPPPTPLLPRVLLVEDDPTSRAFLGAAIEATPADVDLADSVSAALTLARHQRYALWLFDANLPDGSGAGLLAELRFADAETPALAHTADATPATREALLASGFADVLVKPLPSAAVRTAVRQALGLADGRDGAPAGNAPLWDDEAAVRALNGQRAHVDTLRTLFLAELPQARVRIEQAFAGHDHEALGAELHKLRASCGFVGAARLAAAVQALAAAPDSDGALAGLREAADASVAQSPPPA